jgi:hypothetical protein
MGAQALEIIFEVQRKSNYERITRRTNKLSNHCQHSSQKWNIFKINLIWSHQKE